jgi:hypothetical protein
MDTDFCIRAGRRPGTDRILFYAGGAIDLVTPIGYTKTTERRIRK